MPKKDCTTGVLTAGHFDVGGTHTELIGAPAQYLNNPRALHRASRRIAALARPFEPDAVVAPAIGGLPLATAAAMELDLPLSVAERTSGRDFRRLRGAPVSRNMVLVDSTFQSGATVRGVTALVESMGGRIVGVVVAVRIHVIGGTSDAALITIPIRALFEISVHAWRPEECPHCRTRVPIDSRPAVHERTTL